MKREMPIFWGCLFTHNYPFLMGSIKAVLEYLDIEAVDTVDKLLEGKFYEVI